MAGSASFPRNKYWILRHGKSIPNDIGLIVSSMENGTLAKYQLCPEGVDQANAAGELFLKELKENKIPIENVRICYSPFSRTTHTAKILASVLNIALEGPQGKVREYAMINILFGSVCFIGGDYAGPFWHTDSLASALQVIEDLKERYFGPTFELGSHEKYTEIWDLDAKDPFSCPEGGESVSDVTSRLARALETIESEFQGCAILIVSHGDPLQILQTVFNAIKCQSGFENKDIVSSIESVNTASILSQHRKFGLDTAELRRLI